jgi:hypothetical protein
MESEEKFCGKCEKWKKFKEFVNCPGRSPPVSTHCKECTKNRTDKWREKNSSNLKQKSRDSHLKSKYNITHEDYIAILSQQESKCSICEIDLNEYMSQKGKLPPIDHCHSEVELEIFYAISVIKASVILKMTQPY